MTLEINRRDANSIQMQIKAQQENKKNGSIKESTPASGKVAASVNSRRNGIGNNRSHVKSKSPFPIEAEATKCSVKTPCECSQAQVLHYPSEDSSNHQRRCEACSKKSIHPHLINHPLPRFSFSKSLRTGTGVGVGVLSNRQQRRPIISRPCPKSKDSEMGVQAEGGRTKTFAPSSSQSSVYGKSKKNNHFHSSLEQEDSNNSNDASFLGSQISKMEFPDLIISPPSCASPHPAEASAIQGVKDVGVEAPAPAVTEDTEKYRDLYRITVYRQASEVENADGWDSCRYENDFANYDCSGVCKKTAWEDKTIIPQTKNSTVADQRNISELELDRKEKDDMKSPHPSSIATTCAYLNKKVEHDTVGLGMDSSEDMKRVISKFTNDDKDCHASIDSKTSEPAELEHNNLKGVVQVINTTINYIHLSNNIFSKSNKASMISDNDSNRTPQGEEAARICHFKCTEHAEEVKPSSSRKKFSIGKFVKRIKNMMHTKSSKKNG